MCSAFSEDSGQSADGPAPPMTKLLPALVVGPPAYRGRRVRPQGGNRPAEEGRGILSFPAVLKRSLFVATERMFRANALILLSAVASDPILPLRPEATPGFRRSSSRSGLHAWGRLAGFH